MKAEESKTNWINSQMQKGKQKKNVDKFLLLLSCFLIKKLEVCFRIYFTYIHCFFKPNKLMKVKFANMCMQDYNRHTYMCTTNKSVAYFSPPKLFSHCAGLQR